MSVHLEDKPVSATTYRRHGCRCPECTAAASAAQQRSRDARDGALRKVQSRTQWKAVTWVRANCPALWEQFLAESYEELGIERRPRGRP